MTGGKSPVADEIRARLAALEPSHLEIIDESARHAGHSAAAVAGESHFRLRLRVPSLAGASRIARHRAVHAALGPGLLARVHALAIEFEDQTSSSSAGPSRGALPSGA